jgi:17beta-estradiol 17-dehydrogenase / very-long-chain 3-oxoacyl-CoA reductase
MINSVLSKIDTAAWGDWLSNFDTGNSITFKTFAAVGGLTIGYYAFTFINALSLWFTPFRSNFKVYKEKNGKAYAFITGASGGIGLELAKGLVKKGFGVVLVAHVQSELDGAKKQILRMSPSADVHTVCMDAMTFTTDALKAELKKLSHLHFRIVINNVAGMIGSPRFRSISEYTTKEVDDQINCNARFMSHVINLLLPVVKKNAEQDGGRALLLTTGSPGRAGIPYTTIYSGTKGYNSSLSNAIKQECIAMKWPVDVLCILPGEVKTTGHTKGVSPYAQPMEDFGRQTLDLTEPALRRGRCEIIPYWRSAAQFYLLDDILPLSRKNAILRDIMQWKYDDERRELREDGKKT